MSVDLSRQFMRAEGDCFKAGMASLLEVPYDETPPHYPPESGKPPYSCVEWGEWGYWHGLLFWVWVEDLSRPFAEIAPYWGSNFIFRANPGLPVHRDRWVLSLLQIPDKWPEDKKWHHGCTLVMSGDRLYHDPTETPAGVPARYTRDLVLANWRNGQSVTHIPGSTIFVHHGIAAVPVSDCTPFNLNTGEPLPAARLAPAPSRRLLHE